MNVHGSISQDLDMSKVITFFTKERIPIFLIMFANISH